MNLNERIAFHKVSTVLFTKIQNGGSFSVNVFVLHFYDNSGLYIVKILVNLIRNYEC